MVIYPLYIYGIITIMYNHHIVATSVNFCAEKNEDPYLDYVSLVRLVAGYITVANRMSGVIYILKDENPSMMP